MWLPPPVFHSSGGETEAQEGEQVGGAPCCETGTRVNLRTLFQEEGSVSSLPPQFWGPAGAKRSGAAYEVLAQVSPCPHFLLRWTW